MDSKIINDGLTFDQLRRANMARLPLFKNSKGGPAHSKPDGSDWSPAQWLQATIGELGEFANVRKKYERGDLTHAEYVILARKELADVQTYLDILAARSLDTKEGVPHPFGVNLGAATADKWDEVSSRVGCALSIGEFAIAESFELK
jgi:NTP pyrophosphatase (non-canonical NTP hydrolase)